MSFFQKVLIDQLYIAEKNGDDRGSIALVLPRSSTLSAISLDNALHNQELAGIFIFSARELDFITVAEAQAFVDRVLIHTERERVFLWLSDPSQSIEKSAPMMKLAQDGQRTLAALEAPLTPTLSLIVQSGMKLTLPSSEENVLQLEGSGGSRIEFSGPARPDASIATTGTLPFSGSFRGCIQFMTFIRRQSLQDQLNWGFQFLFPNKDGVQKVLAEWLPLADPSQPNSIDMLGFQVTIDPCDVLNAVFDPYLTVDGSCDLIQAYHSRRTFLTFTGQNRASEPRPTILSSYYRTIFGDTLRLWPVGLDTTDPAFLPARLVFLPGALTTSGIQAFHLAPEGDFVLEVEGAAAEMRYDLLCGLHSDELLRVASKTATSNGDRLRFLSRQSAFAPRYPFERISPVEAPVDPMAQLLDRQYMTSWATLVCEQDSTILPYIAQPQGSALFGRDELIHTLAPTLLGHVTPGCPQSNAINTVFPLPPYAGIKTGNGKTGFSAEQIELFEREIVAPTRRHIIGSMTERLASQHSSGSGTPSLLEEKREFTTPSGQIATLTLDEQYGCRWSKILLGQNTRPQLRQMYFSEPDEQLTQAFQSNQLFLVIANATHLGKLVGDDIAEGRTFWNRMNIEDWILQADIGQQNHYGDYTNIMIIKGRRGKLYDPQGLNEENLVANPAQWTQMAAFAAPTTIEQPASPDVKQLVILSQWLQDFFRDASQQKDTVFFEHFNRIASNENWTGILILKMQVQQVPDNLKGILSGIADPKAFFAHHFGIEINQVKINEQGIGLQDASSMFGLISYLDPGYVPKQPEQPVPPLAGALYDFRILALQVLFENTAIKQFRSFAQLTINELFHTPVDHMGVGGNSYNALMLRGSYQNNNGQPLYSMSSLGSGTFYLQNNLLKKVEIVNAQMSTRDPGNQEAIVSWFALNGFLDYAAVQQTTELDSKPFDIFSFGNLPGEDLPRKGLSFNNLGVQMTYSLKLQQQGFAFNVDEMTFDLTSSTPRPGSLFPNFALQLRGLVSGDSEATPAKAGYISVIPDARLGGVDGGFWYGLRFRLNMGTPGELAGKVGLNSYILTAWSPNSTGENSYRALVGLELPGTGGGAKLISLQTVLKLSIGQIRLTYIKEQNSFLLMFTEIALRFLGLLKIPPNGSTLFYLFGNPQSEDKSSGLGWYAIYKQSTPPAHANRRVISES